MKEKKILIVEDDSNIAKLVLYNLEKNGFVCFVADSGEKALELLEKNKIIDGIILDLMLPNIDGLEVCKRVRRDIRIAHIPIIILTAKGEEIDRIVGFELGADDYVVKPFSPRELVLRLKAVLKRVKQEQQTAQNDIIEYGNVVIDRSQHIVTVSNKPVELTPLEFRLLELLIHRKGRVQSREVLLSDVWGIDSDITTRTVDTHVKRLRQKIAKAGKYIKTVRGIGYKYFDEG